jgi:hypothetical protein
MSILVFDLDPGCYRSLPARPSLLWLALALALAIAGLAAGLLAVAAGAPVRAGLVVSLVFSSPALGLAAGMLITEVALWRLGG